MKAIVIQIEPGGEYVCAACWLALVGDMLILALASRPQMKHADPLALCPRCERSVGREDAVAAAAEILKEAGP